MFDYLYLVFENPEKKLKKTSVILFIIHSVITLIIAFGLSLRKEQYDYIQNAFNQHEPETQFDFWLFIVILIIGLSIAFVESLLLYSFGELIDIKKEGNTYLSGIQTLLADFVQNSNADKISDDKKDSKVKIIPHVNPSAKLSKFTVCEKCGTENIIGTRRCYKCGSKLPSLADLAQNEKADNSSADYKDSDVKTAPNADPSVKPSRFIVCEKCGSENKIGNRMCYNCGSKL
ncbi:MAG: zinc ribbon domain-containing protein [Clostridia bacterium]|nr:zinc ribbon domain-containing protein [Clostridia bacterium]